MKLQSNSNETPKPRERLIELRTMVGTQRKVSHDLDISETYLRLLERGLAKPSVELMFKIAHYFETDVYDCWPDLAGQNPKYANLSQSQD